ncbi:Protein of unknown function, DUF393 [Rhizobium tibeticum]|uniref:Thiol-disulfide oxidoreductase DCC n=1 Tax=Rhizobium tibeticum TaxID=501024 RepID=A0A1H8C7Y5_9HYPH|nr:hypothetical protein RTCCBAU85039_0457 [Rhizobium tibeticum]SEM90378.1 Protein of unknown function, DUF393 [Rhizobium tibeticum]
MGNAYSYRSDVAVPTFADDKPLIVFDGACVFCSAWVQFVLRHDKAKRYRFLAAQSPLGEALYRHYELNERDYETNILIEDGSAYFKSRGTIRMLAGLGFRGRWSRSFGCCRRDLPTGFTNLWPATGFELPANARPASCRARSLRTASWDSCPAAKAALNRSPRCGPISCRRCRAIRNREPLDNPQLYRR